MEEIEITYKVLGFEEAGETSFDMEISEKQYERLSDADDEGELLDSDFLSEEMPGIHKKILRLSVKTWKKKASIRMMAKLKKQHAGEHDIKSTPVAQTIRLWR